MSMLQKVKDDLGITSNKRNSEISAAIEAAKRRMEISGVDNIAEFDSLTESAIKLYVRYWLNWQGEGERYWKHFEALRDTMATCGEYRSAE